MKFLADESCAGPVIRARRDAGHDMTAIAEVAQGATGEVVIDRALGERRIVITEDSDFGELVYARGRAAAGVMLVRFPNRVRKARVRRRGSSQIGHTPIGPFHGRGARTGAHRQPTSRARLRLISRRGAFDLARRLIRDLPTIPRMPELLAAILTRPDMAALGPT